jgi:L-asparaginase
MSADATGAGNVSPTAPAHRTADAARPVRVLGAGGTIGMRGERAIPAVDAAALLEQLPLPPDWHVEAETVLAKPGAHVGLDDALGLARRAGASASAGQGVVITTGTDTLEELAVLCALTYDEGAPVVLTGANRPGSRPGADGPANLLDAIALARAPTAAGIGVVVAFGGEIHAAMTVQKVDSTGPAAFGSPATGPIGRVVEGKVWLHATPLRPARLDVRRLAHSVAIVTAVLGDDGALLRHAAASGDGVVLVALGAGHLPPALLRELRHATERAPVLITCRPVRSSMLFRPTGLRARSPTCAPPARSARPSCLRLRRGWRCCARSAPASTGPASPPRWRRSTLVNPIRRAGRLGSRPWPNERSTHPGRSPGPTSPPPTRTPRSSSTATCSAGMR